MQGTVTDIDIPPIPTYVVRYAVPVRWRTPDRTTSVQPSRDSADPRYHAARIGGQGGFSYYAKQGQPAPYRYTAIVPKHEQRALSIDNAVSQLHTPDAIKGKARAVLALALERIADELSGPNEFRLNELAQVASSVGRVSGVQDDEQKEQDIRIHIVRDTPTYTAVAMAHVVPEVTLANVNAHKRLGDGAGADAIGDGVCE